MSPLVFSLPFPMNSLQGWKLQDLNAGLDYCGRHLPFALLRQQLGLPGKKRCWWRLRTVLHSTAWPTKWLVCMYVCIYNCICILIYIYIYNCTIISMYYTKIYIYISINIIYTYLLFSGWTHSFTIIYTQTAISFWFLNHQPLAQRCLPYFQQSVDHQLWECREHCSCL